MAFHSPNRFLRVLCCCFVCLAITYAAHAQYIITDLGTNVTPLGLNNNGDVVGNIQGTLFGDTNVQHAFFYTNGVSTFIPFTPGSTNSGANAINNLDQSVGYFQDNLGGVHAFISTNCSTLTDLGVGVTTFPSANPRWNGASGINDAGQIIGMRNSSNPRVYLIANGQTNNLPTLTGNATDSEFVGGLSQSGAVAYMVSTNGFFITTRACLFTNGVQFVLPTPPNYGAFAFGVNDSNEVVGALYASNAPSTFSQEPFFFDGSTITNIGSFATNLTSSTVPYGINNYEQTVGPAYNTNVSPAALALSLYDNSNGIVDINSLLPIGSGYTLGQANAINDPGQIIGVALYSNKVHGVLLTPGIIFNPGAVKYHSGSFTFSLTAPNGQTVVIQATCDLMSWVPIFTNVVSRNKVVFTDSDSGACPGSRYYRAVLVQ